MLSDSVKKLLNDAIEARLLTVHADSQGHYQEAYFEGNDEHFEAVCQLKDLLILDCDAANITDRSFHYLAGLQQLQSLSIMGCNISGRSFAIIPNLRKLRELHCNPTRDCSAAALFIIQCDNLQSLDVSTSKFENAEIELFCRLPKLKMLSLSQCGQLDDACLRSLREGVVADLDISHTQCGDSAAIYISECENMFAVGLAETAVRGDGIEALGRLSKLRELSLSRLPIESKDVIRLGRCPYLQELRLGYSNVDDDAVEFLLQLPSLQVLDLTATHVSQAGIQRLRSRTWKMLDW